MDDSPQIQAALDATGEVVLEPRMYTLGGGTDYGTIVNNVSGGVASVACIRNLSGAQHLILSPNA